MIKLLDPQEQQILDQTIKYKNTKTELLPLLVNQNFSNYRKNGEQSLKSERDRFKSLSIYQKQSKYG